MELLLGFLISLIAGVVLRFGSLTARRFRRPSNVELGDKPRPRFGRPSSWSGRLEDGSKTPIARVTKSVGRVRLDSGSTGDALCDEPVAWNSVVR